MRKAAALLIVFLIAAGCGKGNGKITASGTIEIKQVDVASMTASRVMKIVKNEGASVKEGDTIALLDDTVVSAGKLAAAVVLSNAKANYERAKDLFSTGAIAKAAYEQSEAMYLSANASYAQANKMYDEATVRAPWSGIILKTYVEEGELVSANTPIFTLGDLNTAKVTIYVPLTDMSKIKYNDSAEITIDAYPKKKFTGRVNFISSEAEFTPKNVQTKDERVKQVFSVEVTVDNKEGILKPGIPADVSIITK